MPYFTPLCLLYPIRLYYTSMCFTIQYDALLYTSILSYTPVGHTILKYDELYYEKPYYTPDCSTILQYAGLYSYMLHYILQCFTMPHLPLPICPPPSALLHSAPSCCDTLIDNSPLYIVCLRPVAQADFI